MSLPFFGILFAGIGFIILVVGAFLGYNKWNFVRTASHAQGVVSEMRENSDRDSSGTYAPVFQFADAAGVTHTIVSSLYSSPPAYHTGEAVEVLYQSSDPKKASINTFFQLWFAPLLCGVMGAVPFGIGMSLILPRRSKEVPQVTAQESIQEPDQPPHQGHTQKPNELPK